MLNQKSLIKFLRIQKTGFEHIQNPFFISYALIIHTILCLFIVFLIEDFGAIY